MHSLLYIFNVIRTLLEMNLADLMNRTMLLDLETTKSGKTRHIGAVLSGSILDKGLGSKLELGIKK
jgi:hypothetical protein